MRRRSAWEAGAATHHAPFSVSTQMSSLISRWPARATPAWRSPPVSVASFSVSFMVPKPHAGARRSVLCMPTLEALTPRGPFIPTEPGSDRSGWGGKESALPEQRPLSSPPVDHGGHFTWPSLSFPIL